MIAFRNTAVSKRTVLAQLRAHVRADEIVKGQYWEGGKGCAVGCTIHSGEHAAYEVRFGIPMALAFLEDRIFEGLPNGAAKAWPVRFMSAVRPGSDLSCVSWQFLHWLLTTPAVNPGIDHPQVRDAVKQCADVLIPLTRGLAADKSAARRAARSAASAESAAWSAAWSAAASATGAAWSAESAEWSAARSAERAAGAARSAAESAAGAARSAAGSAAWSAEWSAARSAARSAAASATGAAWSAESAEWSAARSAAWSAMADKLIALIKAAPSA